MQHDIGLIIFIFFAIVALVVLIARFKVHPFVALILVAIAIGLHADMKLTLIAKTFQEGVGNALGFLSVVVGLGMMLGKMLSVSGGTHVVAQNFIRILGVRRAPWAVLFVAMVVGVSVLFAVGLLLLVPVILAIADETKIPRLKLAIPLCAGLSVSQGFFPPHPGPMLAIEQMGADVGKTLMYAALIGLPTAIVAGPLFANFIVPRLKLQTEAPAPLEPAQQLVTNPPGFGLTLLTMLLPVILMLLASLADLTLPESSFREWVDFIGSPLIAMVSAVLLACYSFGYARGFNGRQISKFLEECVGPAASILLVIGAGGGLSKVLDRGGAGTAVLDIVKHVNISPLLLGWLVAASIRVAVGSATVAITMACAIMAPVAAGTPGINRELLVLAMGAGSLFLSHVNDSGFWLVKESFNLTVTQTLKTWTVLETSIGLVALALVLLVSHFV
jgi:GntP family gluconate:H+ symporter